MSRLALAVPVKGGLLLVHLRSRRPSRAERRLLRDALAALSAESIPFELQDAAKVYLKHNARRRLRQAAVVSILHPAFDGQQAAPGTVRLLERNQA